MKSNPDLAFLLAVYLIRPHLYGPLINETCYLTHSTLVLGLCLLADGF